MTIKFRCPRCKKAFSVKDEYAGKTAKCPCGTKICVPSKKHSPKTPTSASSIQDKAKVTLSYPELGVHIVMAPHRHHIEDISRAVRKSTVGELFLTIVFVPCVAIGGGLLFGIVAICSYAILKSIGLKILGDWYPIPVAAGIGAAVGLVYGLWQLVVASSSPEIEDPKSALKWFLRYVGSVTLVGRAYDLLSDEARQNGCLRMREAEAMRGNVHRVSQVHITNRESFEKYWKIIGKTCGRKPQWEKFQKKHIGSDAVVLSLPFVLRKPYSLPVQSSGILKKAHSAAPGRLDFTASFLLVKRDGYWIVASPWFWPFILPLKSAHEPHESTTRSDEKPESNIEENTVIFDDMAKFTEFKKQLMLLYKAYKRPSECVRTFVY